jgi:hypothetical protein
MMFTLTAAVKSNGREIGFRGLFWVREVLVSRTVAQKCALLITAAISVSCNLLVQFSNNFYANFEIKCLQHRKIEIVLLIFQ